MQFEKDLQPPELPPLSSHCPTLETADVITGLKRLNIKESAGLDKILGMVLKLTAHSVGEPLCDLFNSCLERGQFPLS